jgi:hypothetical protein
MSGARKPTLARCGLIVAVSVGVGCGRIGYEDLVRAQADAGEADGAPSDATGGYRDGAADGAFADGQTDGSLSSDGGSDAGTERGTSCSFASTGGCGSSTAISLFPGQRSSFNANTTDAANVFSGSCGGAESAERFYQLQATSLDVRVSARTVGATFDAVLYVRDACEGNELACQRGTPGGEASIEFTAEAGTTRFLFIDGAEAGRCGTADIVVEQSAL